MHRLARYRSGRVELWITPCVVTMPPPRSTALVVPTNERLCGTQFAHFPKGGPTPAATKIGERDYERPRAERLLYQCESVDGIVTEFGGAAYESAIAWWPMSAAAERSEPTRVVGVPVPGRNKKSESASSASVTASTLLDVGASASDALDHAGSRNWHESLAPSAQNAGGQYFP